MTEILIESESPLWGPPDQWNKLVRRAAEAALEAAWPWGDAHRARAELSVFLTDDAGIRALNRQWRRKDSATNVLAFPMLEPSEAPTGLETVLLGDVVLSHETMAREADTFGISLSDHVAHLVVHGVLHLLGHDHVDDADAERMEALEGLILHRLGIADPYARQQQAA